MTCPIPGGLEKEIHARDLDLNILCNVDGKSPCLFPSGQRNFHCCCFSPMVAQPRKLARRSLRTVRTIPPFELCVLGLLRAGLFFNASNCQTLKIQMLEIVNSLSVLAVDF
jgi:hypothetical protein